MKLPEALDALLRARYTPTALRSPITSKRGLAARVNALEKAYTEKGDRKGAATKRIAAALGISPRTWRRWREGSQTPKGANLTRLANAYTQLTLPAIRSRLKKFPPPNSVKITAEIKWNGYRNQQPKRTTTLGGMRSTMIHTIQVWVHTGPEAAADVFQRGAATAHNVPNDEHEPGILFEGDEVEIEIPWENT